MPTTPPPSCQQCQAPVPPRKPGARGAQSKYCSPSCRSRAFHDSRMADGRQGVQNARRRKTEPRATCQVCDTALPPRRRPGSPRYCSPECKSQADRARSNAHNAVKNAERRRATRRARVERKLAEAAEGSGPTWVLTAGLCAVCGGGFVTWGASLYCSSACRGGRKTPEAAARRKARQRGWRLTKARRLAIYERDDWTCRLCGIPVDRDAAGTMQPDAPCVDHVVPLALGGPHCLENLQTAHNACNLRKGTSLPPEGTVVTWWEKETV